MSETLAPPIGAAPPPGDMPPPPPPLLGAGPMISITEIEARPPGLPPDVPFESAAQYFALRRWVKSKNIADEDDGPDEQEQRKLAARVRDDYDVDKRSRSEWEENYEKWLNFAMQIAEAKSFPWPDASNVIYPMMTTAALQFSARAYPAIIRDQNVVKGVVVGDDTGIPAINPLTGAPFMDEHGPVWKVKPGAKQETADQIGRHMSWQLLEEQEEWEPQTDRMLVCLPIVGTMFRKSYFSTGLRRNVSETVDALDLVVNYYAKSFETAARKTELIRLYPWEIEERIRTGVFLDTDYGHDTHQDGDRGNQDTYDDEDAPTTFLEQHRRYDLDGDGYAEPYIVTVARDSGKLARITAGFEMDGITWTPDGEIARVDHIEYYTKYGFIPNPASVVYDLGFGHLLYPLNAAINTTINQMFDAGTLQNTGGGFVGSGFSINTGAVRFALGEYKPVNVLGGSIRDNIYTMQWPGPSQVLMQLLTFLVEAAERVASVKDIMTGDMPGDNTSGITTLAVIEQGLKVFSAIYKRIHRSLGYEFKKLYRLNRIYLEDTKGFGSGSSWENITRSDYEKGAGVIPISDPQMVTDMQRLGRAQFLMNFINDPGMNGMAIRLEMMKAAMIAQPERFISDNPSPPPQIVLKNRELDIRERREMVDLALRGKHDQALMIKEIAQAELFLAQARKTGNDVDLSWADHHVARLKAEVDALGAITDAAQVAQQGTGDTGGTGA